MSPQETASPTRNTNIAHINSVVNSSSNSTLANEQENLGSFKRLPSEVTIYILTHVGPKELYSISQSCKLLNMYSYDPELWKDINVTLSEEAIHPDIFSITSVQLRNGKMSKGCPPFTQLIEKLPLSLQKLDLTWLNFDEVKSMGASLSSLSRLLNLNELHLGNSEGRPENITAADLMGLRDCSQFKALHLSSLDKITKQDLSQLSSSLTQLEELHLFFMPPLSAADIVQAFPHLRLCRINRNIIPNSSLKKQSKNPSDNGKRDE
ncbi:F-box-like domain-containing protein [Candidatus Odyssella thessalonicensis]|uniref:F-box-like domain-containing protein n=1 Tax=Candidatus Odyssella thessalonicensis TaxID=84647 RepID=UPI000225B4E8|nr:F-box-like domain-containing protein [Candidatus Odyssella thessalonicensis]